MNRMSHFTMMLLALAVVGCQNKTTDKTTNEDRLANLEHRKDSLAKRWLELNAQFDSSKAQFERTTGRQWSMSDSGYIRTEIIDSTANITELMMEVTLTKISLKEAEADLDKARTFKTL